MATKKNDPVKPKLPKDKWGRSPGSKYYNFNPKTQRYEDPKNVYKYPKEGYGKVNYNPVTMDSGIGAQVSNINSARAKDSMQQQNVYYGRPKNAGMTQAQKDAARRSGMNTLSGAMRMTPNAAPKKKIGGLVKSSKKIVKNSGVVRKTTRKK